MKTTPQQITLSSTALRTSVEQLAGFVANNPLAPCLENIHIQANGSGKITLTVSDLTITVVRTITGEGEGDMLLPAGLLNRLLKLLPQAPITLRHNSVTFQVTLTHEDKEYKLSGEDPINFPKVPSLPAQEATIKRADFAAAMQFCANSVGKDDLRPELTGIYLQCQDTTTTAVSTDGHCLQRYTLPIGLGLPNTLVKSSIVKVLNLFTMEHFFLGQSGQHLALRDDSVTAFVRVLDERYPDYENAIPINPPRKATVQATTLRQTLDRIVLMANKKTSQVRLEFLDSTLWVSSEDVDFQHEGREPVALDDLDGPGITIGFNAKNLLRLLHNFDGPLTLCLWRPNRAMTLYSQAEPKKFALIMPMMLSDPTYA